MKRKGFTLIELIVVMAIISILVLLGVPKYKAYTEEAQLTRIKVNIKEIEKASQKYYMTYNDWPRLNDEHLTSVELESYSAKILDLTGEEPTLDVSGKYYELDYESLERYVSIPKDKGNYILQNPVGDVLYLKDLTAEGKENLSNVGKEPQNTSKELYTDKQIADFVSQGYKIVQTPDDLNNVRNNLSGKYIQVCDIDLSSYGNWSPIGDNTNRFTGIYNGGGYEISNLTINTPMLGYVGLFGYINGGNISNIGVTNVFITGYAIVGGLVGNTNNSTISNSYSTGSVTGGEDYFAGGLVGLNVSSIISNSYSTCNVTGFNEVGGLVGRNYNSSIISNSYSTGDIIGNSQVGGLVGCLYSSTIINSYSIGNVTGKYSSVGGLLGQNFTNGTISNSYWDKDSSRRESSAGGTGKTTLDMYKQSTYVDWDFDTVWKINEGQSYPSLQWQN